MHQFVLILCVSACLDIHYKHAYIKKGKHSQPCVLPDSLVMWLCCVRGIRRWGLACCSTHIDQATSVCRKGSRPERDVSSTAWICAQYDTNGKKNILKKGGRYHIKVNKWSKAISTLLKNSSPLLGWKFSLAKVMSRLQIWRTLYFLLFSKKCWEKMRGQKVTQWTRKKY